VQRGSLSAAVSYNAPSVSSAGASNGVSSSCVLLTVVGGGFVSFGVSAGVRAVVAEEASRNAIARLVIVSTRNVALLRELQGQHLVRLEVDLLQEPPCPRVPAVCKVLGGLASAKDLVQLLLVVGVEAGGLSKEIQSQQAAVKLFATLFLQREHVCRRRAVVGAPPPPLHHPSLTRKKAHCAKSNA